ncbi:uncharacterized protein HMPREF1120_01958 [Exophiala dermatitidis NIH/UT8656]|uniref:Uncharacterized protein n=1 Tax=Exophiala dermatitidis (strain ATCC 34100 / CBS 525.76 / NIH/UT8656) TaxID=858893 RepID=H6BQA4_EXODN|nr:uncharacterized protein HMPREF1120_01958 [Exophiala dermatitidis NIH/UT8656]EHY53774.1 hypothetical protein HMPREF1120_01958 [Exophiala dermatitidis NIH/UT8656]
MLRTAVAIVRMQTRHICCAVECWGTLGLNGGCRCPLGVLVGGAGSGTWVASEVQAWDLSVVKAHGWKMYVLVVGISFSWPSLASSTAAQELRNPVVDGCQEAREPGSRRIVLCDIDLDVAVDIYDSCWMDG